MSPSGAEEPDYRFTLANERTFLAWIRTALAFAAGGVAVIGFISDARGASALAATLLGLSVLIAGGAYRRWLLSDRAIRKGEPLPPALLPRLLAVGVVVVGILSALVFVLDRA